MTRKHPVFFLFTWLLSCIAYGQHVITGKVLDATSKEPLSNASVFCENTTLFTVADQKGDFSFSIKPGGYNLIVSYTGYETQSIRITESSARVIVLLKRETGQLKEVVVASKSKLVENGWNDYGWIFKKNFIGTTPNAQNCSFLNPEVLRFYYYSDDNKIKVFAKKPLNIVNKALGYTLAYNLDSFVYYFDNLICTYQGNCLFTEMNGSETEKKRWAKNRKTAYYGSVLHFMRSYYRGTLQSEGWDIAMQQVDDEITFDRVANPYDSLLYTRFKEERKIEIQYPRRLRVNLSRKIIEPEYVEIHGLNNKMTTQSSAVDLKGTITIKENGYYYDQLSWVTYNYWSWKNVADLLPYDYMP